MISVLRVLVFALLQFAASVNASTPSDCKMGACASQIDDATAMIQSKAKVSLASEDEPILLMKSSGMGQILQVKNSEKITAAQKMENSMEIAVTKIINGSSVAPSPDFFEPIETQMELMKVELVAESGRFQSQMDLANSNVAKCNQNMQTTSDGSVATAKAQADARNITHHTCRGAEKVAHNAKVSSCNSLDKATNDTSKNAPQCNCALSDSSDTSSVLTCLASNRNWVETHQVVLKTKHSDCNNKTTAWSNKADDCDTKQTSYEEAVCSYGEDLENMRTTLDTCYNDAISARTSAKELAEVEVEHLKAVLASAKKIVCFLSLLKRAGTEKITMSDFDTCKKMDVHTNKTYLNVTVPDMNITYSPADPKDTDDFQWDLSTMPGDSQWAADAYAGYTTEWLRETAICLHKTTTTTAPAVTADDVALGTLGTASCPTGYGLITDLETCKLAIPHVIYQPADNSGDQPIEFTDTKCSANWINAVQACFTNKHYYQQHTMPAGSRKNGFFQDCVTFSGTPTGTAAWHQPICLKTGA